MMDVSTAVRISRAARYVKIYEAELAECRAQIAHEEKEAAHVAAKLGVLTQREAILAKLVAIHQRESA